MQTQQAAQAATPAQAPAHNLGHWPLPAGPYPTAKWPEGLTHLQQPGDAQ